MQKTTDILATIRQHYPHLFYGGFRELKLTI